MSQVTYPLGMPKELLKEVKAAADETGLSMADVMRQAIKLGMPRVRQALSSVAEEVSLQPGSELAPKFKLVKRDGFTVIQTDRRVSQETIHELLSELP
jgi:hypothetical protein